MPDENTDATSLRLKNLEEDVKALEKQVTLNQVELARLSERLTVYALLQSAYATAAAAIGELKAILEPPEETKEAEPDNTETL